jgi:hypothetical protein
VGRTEAAYDAAVQNLSDPSLREALEATLLDGSDAELFWLGWYDLVVAEGYVYSAPSDGENTTTLMPGAVVYVDASGRVAAVEVCAASGDTILDRDASGAEVVVSTGWAAYHQVQTFILGDDGTEWLMATQVDLNSYPGARSCEEPTSSSVPLASLPAP